MISMDEFKRIIQLRNKGLTQEQIANELGVHRRTIIRYLKFGNIPKYERKDSSKSDPMKSFYESAEKYLQENPNLTLTELFEYLETAGYTGSLRTLRRKTQSLRASLKRKEVYFQREKIPGEVMEGDFTSLWVNIGGVQRHIYLWVVVLNYSTTIFATPFYHQTFECFCDGTIAAIEEFGGFAKRYRLDNLSPVVTKILSGKDRIVTKRYSDFQKYYGWYQDFCNPGAGNEKGSVESVNKHLKRRLLNKIKMNKLNFKDLESFKFFVWECCRELNRREEVQEKKKEENLLSLPITSFDGYQLEIIKINKYSLFTIGTSKHFYSAPSEYVGMRLEARIYPARVDLYLLGSKVASHQRIYGVAGLTSIKLEHIIGALCKKPGILKEWKHKEILFERSSWKRFYKKLEESGESNPDKHYLLCLNLIKRYNRENVTAAMEIVLEEGMRPTSKSLLQILEEKNWDIMSLEPVIVDLKKYDNLLTLRSMNDDGNYSGQS
jgi:transposase